MKSVSPSVANNTCMCARAFALARQRTYEAQPALRAVCSNLGPCLCNAQRAQQRHALLEVPLPVEEHLEHLRGARTLSGTIELAMGLALSVLAMPWPLKRQACDARQGTKPTAGAPQAAAAPGRPPAAAAWGHAYRCACRWRPARRAAAARTTAGQCLCAKRHGKHARPAPHARQQSGATLAMRGGRMRSSRGLWSMQSSYCVSPCLVFNRWVYSPACAEDISDLLWNHLSISRPDHCAAPAASINTCTCKHRDCAAEKGACSLCKRPIKNSALNLTQEANVLNTAKCSPAHPHAQGACYSLRKPVGTTQLTPHLPPKPCYAARQWLLRPSNTTP